MLNSPRSSGRSSVAVRSILLVVGAIGLGVAAEWVGYGFNEPIHWVPDLATGWALSGAGLVAWSRRPGSFVGPLLLVSGVAWFAGGFARPVEAAVAAALGVGPGSWVAASLFVAHRAPLTHAILTYPSGRATTRLESVAVATAYASVVLPFVWQSTLVVIAASVALVAVAYLSYRRALGPERRARRHASRVASGLAIALVAAVAIRVVYPTGLGPEASILVYDLAVLGASFALGARLVGDEGQIPAVVDFVVELGQTQGGPLRDALADALGDPSLQVGYWMAGQSAYVDAGGQRIVMPDPGAGRAVTPIDRDGIPVAVLIHDRSVLGDPVLVDAVAVAAQLGSRNVRLQAEVRRQLVDLQDSRLRLIESADAERRRLEQRLREGARARLENVATDIGLADAAADGSPATTDRVDRARDLATKTLEDLQDLADGLHPAELRTGGLTGALEKLAGRSPIPVQLDVGSGTLPKSIEAAVYFLCAEAIANAIKHAHAREIRVSLSLVQGRVLLSVADDGRGEADAHRGTGLLGLADRVEALGGRLDVQSPAGRGTRVTAELPLDGDGER